MASYLGKYISKSGKTYYYRATDLGSRVEIEFVDQHSQEIADPILRRSAEQTIENMEAAD